MTATPRFQPPASSAIALFARESGLFRPQRPCWTCPPDSHLTLALAVAGPVWLGLMALAGTRLQVVTTVGAWLSLVLLQPVLEELVFRGILQGQALRLLAVNGRTRKLGPLTLANVLVTLAFAALHLVAQPPGWALAVSLPSLVFGHLRERFGSVWPAVCVHAFYNAGFGLSAWLAHQPPP